ncbi:MAG: elongation factor P [Candidatus Shikimatogenerans sp. Tser]|uniref:Elongation factor P n=1 Tax=Candidatus Shikimatogenerans sp. Tser TaxID=3158568 RepID=A0AAU7QQH6_9FLAO
MIKINYLKLNNILYKVIDFLHVKPGKGIAFIKLKLKNILNGNVIYHNISNKKKIKNIKIINKYYKYLYNKNNIYYFINEKFSQINIILNKKIDFFYKVGDKVNLFFEINNNNKSFLFIKNPKYLISKVVKIYISDNRNNYNIVKLDNKLLIKVPLFIKINNFIKINLLKKKYIERIKKK